jgi:putative spermidine/putrescine transport system permease protein
MERNLTEKQEQIAMRYRKKQKLMKGLKALPFWILILGFIIVILGMTLSVLLSAFSTAWFGKLLPEGYTMNWFIQAWKQYEIWSYYKITLEITIASTLISLILSIPGAYILARKDFPFKSGLISFYQLPFMLPEIAYAIPIASIFYAIGLAETIPGLIIVQLLIGIPFSLFILMPFIEALDPRLEVAAMTLGASRYKMFTRIIVPQLIPGITAASINIFIRMFSTFLIILLIAGPNTQTLPVMVFSVLESAGSQTPQMVDALTLSLMFPLLFFTFVSLWVSNYTKRKTGR